MTTSIPTRPSRPYTTANRPYRAIGAAASMWTCRDLEVVLEGPAGTGKSRGALEKAHWCASKYPGARILLTRKTRESMTESTLVTFEEQVLPEGSPLIGSVKRSNRHSYDYPNGSTIVVAGMTAGGRDQRARIMSTEFDMVFGFEWTEASEHDHETLLTRLRNGRMPYQQLIADCNPDSPLHWLHLRCDRAQAQVFFSKHEDNPRLFDRRAGTWTPFGALYIRTLDALSGSRKQRLRYGQRAAADRVIYDTWDGTPGGNVTPAAAYVPGAGPVFWSVDDGYGAGSAQATAGRDPLSGHYVADAHPRVFLLAQLKPDGHLDVFAEHHGCLLLSDAHIRDVLALPYPAPEFATIGPGFAELRGRLNAAGIATQRVQVDVEESIKVVQSAVAADANGWRCLRVHPDCTLLRAEMLSYVRDPATQRPVKAFDHAVDGVRYLVWKLRRQIGGQDAR